MHPSPVRESSCGPENIYPLPPQPLPDREGRTPPLGSRPAKFASRGFLGVSDQRRFFWVTKRGPKPFRNRFPSTEGPWFPAPLSSALSSRAPPQSCFKAAATRTGKSGYFSSKSLEVFTSCPEMVTVIGMVSVSPGVPECCSVQIKGAREECGEYGTSFKNLTCILSSLAERDFTFAVKNLTSGFSLRSISKRSDLSGFG